MVSVWSPWRLYRHKSGKRPLKILRRFECNLLEVSSFKIVEMTASLLFDYFEPKNHENHVMTSLLEPETNFFGFYGTDYP